ncbi:MAG: hypothetical protein NW224_14815 [Leptolyngbyaceae cyanobacterium bins.302]|nr:hypothetical protein [Leptolyngbyaceae cyanobacterium bins.302]
MSPVQVRFLAFVYVEFGDDGTLAAVQVCAISTKESTCIFAAARSRVTVG